MGEILFGFHVVCLSELAASPVENEISWRSCDRRFTWNRRRNRRFCS